MLSLFCLWQLLLSDLPVLISTLEPFSSYFFPFPFEEGEWESSCGGNWLPSKLKPPQGSLELIFDNQLRIYVFLDCSTKIFIYTWIKQWTWVLFQSQGTFTEALVYTHSWLYKKSLKWTLWQTSKMDPMLTCNSSEATENYLSEKTKDWYFLIIRAEITFQMETQEDNSLKWHYPMVAHPKVPCLLLEMACLTFCKFIRNSYYFIFVSGTSLMPLEKYSTRSVIT